MFNRLDQWVYHQVAKRNISLEPSVSRWGMSQIAICVFLFLFALSASFFALSLSSWGMSMYIMVKTVCILALAGGIFVFIYWLHLMRKWLAEGSKDITATKTDTVQITEKLDMIVGRLDLIAGKLGVSKSEIEAATQNKPIVAKRTKRVKK